MVNLLRARTFSLFAAVGGWRTIAEAVGSRMLFLVVYLFTGHVLLSALVALGGVLVFTVVRVCTNRKWWQAGAALLAVGISTLLAGSTGRGVDFYLPDVVRTTGAGLVMLVSMLVRWPMAGVILGLVGGERFGWRRDPVKRRRYQACTALFLAKFVLLSAVLLPLYLTGNVVTLGIATSVLNVPLLAGCMYLCWRILHKES